MSCGDLEPKTLQPLRTSSSAADNSLERGAIADDLFT
jgi:hypothetical protein